MPVSRTVPVGVRLRDVPSGGVAELARAASALDASGTGFVVLGTQVGGLDPSTVASFLARRTSGLGLVVEAAPQRDHPYNIARRVASLDHLTRGRAGWWVLSDDDSTELGLGVRSSWVDAPRSTRNPDAVTAVRALWRTWPAAAVVGDVESNIFTRAEDIRYADHRGVFTTAGPLTVPTTPQGEPVIFGPGTSDIAVEGDTAFASVSVDAIGSALDAGASGVVVDVHDLDAWLHDVLPGLIQDGVVRPRRSTTTLRGYLNIGLPAEPDLSANRPVYT
ncbi:LLM class flavin-dependent oxidoreductase [Rhodococcoides fascians]|uniref:LLM class flavin-dependent oxidoreductase n=1 Tax=Rhodococcoides fascians TaxID=1828 RepID=UPI001E64AF9B|nr:MULTISPECIES: LLM class flavin-dependent oxidoreductase [Rhodococcus]